MADNNTKIILTAEDRASATLATVKGHLGGMAQSADLASRALAGIGVTFSAAAMVAMVKGTIDAADGFNDLAQRVGIGIQELAGWTLAANQSGTSMEAVAKGVKGLSTYMVENSEKLRAAGITATDANGAMIQLADIFKAMPDGVHKTALAVQLFGKSGMEMIPMLNQGSAGLKESQEKAAEYGRRMAAIAPDADKFNDQLAEMALQNKGLGISIAQHFLPGLIGVSQWLIDIKNNGENAYQAIEWMFGERGARAAALLGLGRAGLSQSASGTIGGAKPKSLTAEEEAALGDKNSLVLDGIALLDKEKAASAAKTRLDQLLEAQKKRIAELNGMSGDEQMVSADTVTRKYEKAMDDRAAAMDEAHMARMEAHRIEMEGEGAMQAEIDKNNKAIKKQTGLAKDLGFTFASAFEDAIVGGKGLSSILQGLAQDVQRIFVRKTVTEPLANSLGGLFGTLDFGNLFGGSGGEGGFDWMPSDALSFAGGGFTGGGPRSGGLDGQGGFLAMLHPNETVTDHALGGTAGGGVTVQLNFAVGIAQTVRAEVMAMMPQIQAATTAGIIDARRRGGAVRAAFAG